MPRRGNTIPSLRSILTDLIRGAITLEKAERLLRLNAIAVVDDFARLDVNRYQRRGVPEIVFGSGKTDRQIGEIAVRLMEENLSRGSFFPILVSRISESTFAAACSRLTKRGFLGHRSGVAAAYYRVARMGALLPKARNASHCADDGGRVALLSAGTSDRRVMSEAEVFLELAGVRTLTFNDVGVAALHRLKGPLVRVNEFDPDAVIVAAGMEGALPSVIAGLSAVPVIGVPTSAGYGYGGLGESALMSMLQACSLGISVVNVDSGVGAGVVASLIARRCAEARALARERPRGKKASYRN
jgi:NCAIR mutase (PurE)-related protein